eukprot:16058-Chlamydomonas_euryale.AAC.1
MRNVSGKREGNKATAVRNRFTKVVSDSAAPMRMAGPMRTPLSPAASSWPCPACERDAASRASPCPERAGVRRPVRGRCPSDAIPRGCGERVTGCCPLKRWRCRSATCVRKRSISTFALTMAAC